MTSAKSPWGGQLLSSMEHPLNFPSNIKRFSVRLRSLSEGVHMPGHQQAVWLLTLLFGCLAAEVQSAPLDKQIEFFESKIRPVLAEHCVRCHGAKKQEMGLRLDTADAVSKGGDAGPVIFPGKSDESPFIEALRHSGPLKMPPDAKLPESVIHDMEIWINLGAIWPEGSSPIAPPSVRVTKEHWAFQPVKSPLLPLIKRMTRVTTPIDVFVVKELESAGLSPSPMADRPTLLRRLTFDLTGLPPTTQEIDQFENDPAPDDLAWSRQVDRLLASTHLGERWGRHWLDIARYADTKGYVFFEDSAFPWAWTYRDYVISALNEDRPYDQFVTEQIAADLIQPEKDPIDLRALGFLTVGGRFMNNVHDVIDDRIDVVSRGLMGLTVGCARCHDHKYDPVSQADYYALYGIFASSAEPEIPPAIKVPGNSDTEQSFQAELRVRQVKLAEYVQLKRAQLEASAQRRVAEYLLEASKLRSKPATEDFMLIADGEDLNPTILGRWQTYLDRARREFHPVLAAYLAFEDIQDKEFASRASERLAALDQTGPDKTVNPLVLACLREKPLLDRADLARRLTQVLLQTEAIWQDFRRRTELEGRPTQALADPAREELRQVFHDLDAPSNIVLLPYGNLTLLPDRPSQEEFKKLLGSVEQWIKTGPGAPPRAMVLNDLPQPVEPRIFLRGNPNRPGSSVARRPPKILTRGVETQVSSGSGRLELARAVVDRSNPLTMRVLVNRVWMHHFGTPLVGTPSDFGIRSDPPTHPELLDWLTNEFIEHGHSIKWLHRTILCSSTYRQSSAHNTEAEAIDPDNQLLWRMNRRRFDLEQMRDAMLKAAGQLDERIGGPSFPGLVDPMTPRRTIYASIDRLNLPGVFRTFDFPEPSSTNPRRDQTSVPPQALFLMNHPFAQQMSQAILSRPEAFNLNFGSRLDFLFRQLFQRPPDNTERQLATTFLSQESDQELGWQRLIHALMLTNEFFFVD